MIDESPRQHVYDAIDQDIERNPFSPRSMDRWIFTARYFLDRAQRAIVKDSPKRIIQTELLHAAATLVACLEQHGVVEECEHDWWAQRIVEGGGVGKPDWNHVEVCCRKCGAIGKVKNLGLHELKLTSKVLYVADCRWYDPERVIVEE